MAPSRGWLCSPPAVALGRVALLLTALQPVMPLSPDSSDTLLRPASLRRGLLLGLLTFLFFDEILVFGERHLTSAATVRRARCPRPDLRVWRDMPAEEAQAPLIARLDNFCNCKYAFLQLDNFCITARSSITPVACSLVAVPRTSAITVSTLLTRTNCVRTASELLAVAAVWCTTASGACLQLVANKMVQRCCLRS